MSESKIEWTDRTWNPTRGCSLVSEGCTNCYAMRTAHRFSGEGGTYEGLTRISGGRPVWTGEVRLAPDKLAEPLSWWRPQTIFVNSMSDLFHESLSDMEIAAVFGVMAACPQITFQVLTKRALRMREWFGWVERRAAALSDSAARRSDWEIDGSVGGHLHPELVCRMSAQSYTSRVSQGRGEYVWPLPNVHLGVSVENQRDAARRIPELLQTPAALRFISAEPLLEAVPYLGEVMLGDDGVQSIDWVIVGGESGPGARPCAVEWIRGVVEQCRVTKTPVFVKQLGAWPHEGWDAPPGYTDLRPIPLRMRGRKVAPFLDLKDPKGGDMTEWPEDLRAREFPRVRHG